MGELPKRLNNMSEQWENKTALRKLLEERK